MFEDDDTLHVVLVKFLNLGYKQNGHGSGPSVECCKTKAPMELLEQTRKFLSEAI